MNATALRLDTQTQEDSDRSGIHLKIPSIPPLPDPSAPARAARRRRAAGLVMLVAAACGTLGFLGAVTWFGRITMPMVGLAVIAAAVQVFRGRLASK